MDISPFIKIEFVELYRIDEIENHRVNGTIAVQYKIGEQEVCMNISVILNDTDPDMVGIKFKEIDGMTIERLMLTRARQVFSLSLLGQS